MGARPCACAEFTSTAVRVAGVTAIGRYTFVVAGADLGVVHVDLACDALEDVLVNRSVARRKRADLVAKVVALDVDRLDVLARELVLALLLGKEALRGGLLGGELTHHDQLNLDNDHKDADERMERAQVQDDAHGEASGDHVLQDEVKADDAKDDHDDHGEHGGVAAPLEALGVDVPNEEQVGGNIDCRAGSNGEPRRAAHHNSRHTCCVEDERCRLADTAC